MECLATMLPCCIWRGNKFLPLKLSMAQKGGERHAARIFIVFRTIRQSRRDEETEHELSIVLDEKSF